MGNSAINGPCSIAFCMFTRAHWNKQPPIENNQGLTVGPVNPGAHCQVVATPSIQTYPDITFRKCILCVYIYRERDARACVHITHIYIIIYIYVYPKIIFPTIQQIIFPNCNHPQYQYHCLNPHDQTQPNP